MVVSFQEPPPAPPQINQPRSAADLLLHPSLVHSHRTRKNPHTVSSSYLIKLLDFIDLIENNLTASDLKVDGPHTKTRKIIQEPIITNGKNTET